MKHIKKEKQEMHRGEKDILKKEEICIVKRMVTILEKKTIL